MDIPKIADEGILCFAEAKNHIPFSIKRIYYIFGVEKDATRGLHAHKKTLQMLFCIKGEIKIVLDNGFKREEIVLDKPNKGVFLDKLLWHEMADFGKDTLLLVLASDYYKESDYIRDYGEFIKVVNPKKRKVPQHIETAVLKGA